MDTPRECVIRLLEEDIRPKLLDLTNRNRLLNFRYTSRCMRIVDEQPGQVFDYLVKQGKPMTFLALPEEPQEETADGDGDTTKLLPDPDDSPVIDLSEDLPLPEYPEGEIPEKHRDDKLQTKLEADLLETRLRRISSDASSFIQETGNNYLFLALGFLHWKERTDTAESHEAPLILIPVKIQSTLNRKVQRYIYKMQYTGADLVPNLSLRERLRRDHALRLPMFNEIVAEGATGEEELDPEAYFDIIGKAVAEMPGWEVRRRMVVGFFSFAKLQMYLDLDPNAWPNSCIADHDLIQRLLGCREYSPDCSEDTSVDETRETDSLPLVLDADSSQAQAIQQALGGGRPSMVIQGPPGTGKSQTITNLIACFLAESKSVLFVAEKKAALEVVFRNMQNTGLSSFCLELHSHKADRKTVLRSLEASCKERERFRRIQVGQRNELERLRSVRDFLAEYIELIKKPVGPNAETVFDVFGKVELLRQKLSGDPAIQIENVETVTSEQMENARDLIDNLSRLIHEIGLPVESPWYGYEPVQLFGGQEHRVSENLEIILARNAKILDDARGLFEQIEIEMCTPELTYAQLQAMCELDPALVPKGLLTDLAKIVLTGSGESLLEEAKSWKSSICDYHKKRGEAATFLVDPDQLLPEDLHGLYQSADEASALGLASLDLGTALEFRDTSKRLAALLDDFRGSMRVPVAAGLREPRTLTDIKPFARLVSLTKTRPQGICREVCEGFLAPSSRIVFTRMMEEGLRLARTRQELGVIFALSDVCPPEELTSARRIFRRTQGQMSKVLSSEYRHAMRVVRGFMRQPSQAKWPGMAERLEILETFLAEESEFSTSDQYSEICGEMFKGLETNWKQITTFVTWLTNVCDACDSIDLAKVLVELKSDAEDEWPAEGALLQLATQIEKESCRYRDTVSAMLDTDALASTEHTSIETLSDRLHKLARALTNIEGFLAADAFNKGASLADILKAVELQSEAQALRAEIEADESLKSLAGSHFEGVDTDIDGIIETIEWALSIRKMGLPLELIKKMKEVGPQDLLRSVKPHTVVWKEDLAVIRANIEALAEFGPLDAPQFLGNRFDAVSLEELESRIGSAVSAIGYLTRWADYCRVARLAHDAGLEVILRLMESGRLDPAKAADAYSYAVYDSTARRVLREHPRLATFTTVEYESKRKAFAELDAQLLERHRQEIAHTVSLKKVPSGTSGTRVRELTDMRLLKHQFPLKRHPAIRQLMDRAGAAIRSLTPVFMMSPMSVAQFLEPGKHTFDVVIMDEASQIQPPDALGAIARARQMIVVGDSKQLPPTNFFDKAMNNPDDDQQEETIFNSFDADQSILDKCTQPEFPLKPLLWHYRSEHESLIAFSNTHWYDNELIIFPSSGVSTTQLGIVYHYLGKATYTPGKNVNEIEGESVARKIIEHARRSPELSLGVGTFNLKQRILIEDMLAKLTKEDPSADLSLRKLNTAYGGMEPLFIKNLENLQGDQRDVIFISCTFGPDKETGRVYQRFGPLVAKNGWRRLNVLITRAKKRVEVFTSMKAEDITLEPGRDQEGRKALKEYLKYAETGCLPDYGRATDKPPDSDFERAVAQVVRNLGYEVEPQVGVAGYFVDIGVRHPQRPDEYVLGIECDGAQYHSSVHARDRDRLREGVLRRRDWEIHRIWSTDWFKNREPETVRLKRVLEEVVQRSTARVVVEEAKSEALEPAVAPTAEPRMNDKELYRRIEVFCRENIPRSEEMQRIDGFLNPVVLDALVAHRITNRADFHKYVASDVESHLHSNDRQYLDDIFDIIEQAT